MDHSVLDADLHREILRLDEHSLDDQTKIFLEMSLPGNEEVQPTMKSHSFGLIY